MPQFDRIRRIAANEHVFDGLRMTMGGWTIDYRLDRRRHRFRFADPGQSIVGMDKDDAVVVRTVKDADVGIFNA
jgi:hypothetical protein